MDSLKKIYLLKTNDLSQFVITRTIDFSLLDISEDISALQQNDWVRLHMSERTLTIGSRTYCLENNLSLKVKVQNACFDQEKENPEEEQSENKQAETWKISQIHSMPTTTSLIAQC